MKNYFLKVSILTILGIVFFRISFAKVVINEIAWMGTKESSKAEWFELYNTASHSINLGSWKFQSEDNSLKINLKGRIPGRGFFLLERNNDKTIPKVKADFIYKGNFNNQGENLTLIDNRGETEDAVKCQSGWFAGENSTKKTMARKNALLSGELSSNWQNSKISGGTPKAKNDFSKEGIGKNRKLPKSNTSLPLFSNVYLNEILPSPQGKDANNEWIEIVNRNNFEVNISGWKLKDTIGQIKTYTFPSGTKIKSQKFLVLSRPQTKIVLQNTGDKLELLQPNGNVLDEVAYQKAPFNQSYNRTNSGWSWSIILTPGKKNILVGSKEFKSPPREISSFEVKNFGGGDQKSLFPPERGVISAKISDYLPNNSSSLITIIFASLIALSSAIIALALNKK